MRVAVRCLTVVGAATLAIGCGGMSKQEVRDAWTATSGAMSSGQGNVSQQSQALSNENADSVTVTYSCMEDGSVEFTGEWASSGQGEAEFSLELLFDSCVREGVQIDGDLAWTQSISGSDDSFAFEWTYTGNLTYAGEVVGECPVDMTGSFQYGGDNLLEVATNSGYSWGGTICGRRASATLDNGGYGFQY